jgi:hypothetical protein
MYFLTLLPRHPWVFSERVPVLIPDVCGPVPFHEGSVTVAEREQLLFRRDLTPRMRACV